VVKYSRTIKKLAIQKSTSSVDIEKSLFIMATNNNIPGYCAPYYLPCKVLSVVDGDTYHVEILLTGQAFGYLTTTDTIRLAELNLWEVRGAEKQQGLAAKQVVKDWIGDGIGLWAATSGSREFTRGKYGRLVADIVRQDGSSLVQYLRTVDGGIHVKSG